jgi:hypothetical protein
MPPRNVRTIRQLIYWEYAKLISGSALGDRKNYGFVMHTYKKLESGRLAPSAILRENQKLVEGGMVCAYCGEGRDLQWEHIIPRSRRGPDTIDNMVLACRACNLAKSDRDPFEWYGLDRRYEVPRLVLGKYLKLAFDFHEQAGTLDAEPPGGEGLSVFDLGAIFINVTAQQGEEAPSCSQTGAGGRTQA